MKGGCGFPMGPFACSTWSGSTRRSPSSARCTPSSRDPNFRSRPLLPRAAWSPPVNSVASRTNGFYDYS
ncbi:MAG: hypothetical protein R2697_02135 [Ilumatobacteraceae bacterium]